MAVPDLSCLAVNGCSMIIDPFGDIIAECRSFNDSFETVTILLKSWIRLEEAGIFKQEDRNCTEILSVENIILSRK